MHATEYDEPEIKKNDSFFNSNDDEDDEAEEIKKEEVKQSKVKEMTKEKANQITQKFVKEYEKIPNVTKPSSSPAIEPVRRRQRPLDLL